MLATHCAHWDDALACPLLLVPSRLVRPCLTCCAGSVVPDLPAIAKETMSLIFNLSPIKSVDVYAGMSSGWWGASMQVQGILGVGALLGAFNLIVQEVGFPSLGNFKPRMSIAGRLTGTGLPIAIGRCSMADGKHAMLEMRPSTGNAPTWKRP